MRLRVSITGRAADPTGSAADPGGLLRTAAAMAVRRAVRYRISRTRRGECGTFHLE